MSLIKQTKSGSFWRQNSSLMVPPAVPGCFGQKGFCSFRSDCDGLIFGLNWLCWQHLAEQSNKPALLAVAEAGFDRFSLGFT